MALTTVNICDEELTLHSGKAIYWAAQKTLFIADLHLGKATHFRRAGIAVPDEVEEVNLKNLEELIQEFEVETVYFLGDLFHSEYNAEWESFGVCIGSFPNIHFGLIQGNHDILPATDYERIGLKVYQELKLAPFILTHEPLEKPHPKLYNLCGHIHPGVRLRGKARQSARVACFYFNHHQAILPAFGTFTGKALVRPTKKDRVFVVIGDEVLEV